MLPRFITLNESDLQISIRNRKFRLYKFVTIFFDFIPNQITWEKDTF